MLLRGEVVGLLEGCREGEGRLFGTYLNSCALYKKQNHKGSARLESLNLEKISGITVLGYNHNQKV